MAQVLIKRNEMLNKQCLKQTYWMKLFGVRAKT